LNWLHVPTHSYLSNTERERRERERERERWGMGDFENKRRRDVVKYTPAIGSSA